MKLLLFIFVPLFIFAHQAEALPSLSAPKEVTQQHESFAFLRPIKKQLVQWNILINREIPKHMKALKDNPTPAVLFTSILAALAYGILHTLGPGHGKMVVASYFLTNRAHFFRGVFVGAQVAFSHVAGAVFLVFATDIVMSQFFTAPQAQVFWVRSISYGLISLVGLFMLFQAVRHALGKREGSSCGHCSSYEHRTKKEAILSWCIGAVPCTGSLLILLYAMAHDMMWLGLTMVVFVALGMTISMTTIGIICIFGKKNLIDRYIENSLLGHTWRISLEILGALVITLLGILLLSTMFV